MDVEISCDEKEKPGDGEKRKIARRKKEITNVLITSGKLKQALHGKLSTQCVCSSGSATDTPK
jgi:hypothetical protein